MSPNWQIPVGAWGSKKTSDKYLNDAYRAEWRRIDAQARALARLSAPPRRLAVTSNEWAESRKRIFARDSFLCTYCGQGGHLECDHIVPVSAGGSDKDDNLTTSCRKCNRSKGSKSLKEWRPA